jgi:hypothetical protein
MVIPVSVNGNKRGTMYAVVCSGSGFLIAKKRAGYVVFIKEFPDLFARCILYGTQTKPLFTG